MRLGAGLLLLCGCEVLFPLDLAPGLACPVEPMAACQIDDPDEDGDDVPDACDPCPAVPDGDDTDLDGIGDDCDPAPDVRAACNVRRFFGLGDDTGWDDMTGWTFDGYASNPSTDSLAVLRSTEIRGPGRVETVLVDQEPTASDSLAGVIVLAGPDRGLLCAIHPIDGGLGTLVLARVVGDREELIEESPVEDDQAFSVTPGQIHRLRLSVFPDGRVVCRSDGASDGTRDFSLDFELESMETELPVTGAFGLAIRSLVQNSFEYLDFVPH